MRMISGFGYRNPEGYPDPTAYSAINNVEKTPVENKTSSEDEERFHKLLNTIFTICELAGFHIEGRIVKQVKFGGNYMKICKVRPDHSACSACLATQEMCNVVDDCSKCKLNTDTYELLQIGVGFLSVGYAMVQKDGKITKVSLSRIYDVKEAL